MSYDIIIGRDDSDKKKFGDRGLVKIGKGFVKMGQYTSLSNNIYLDVARSHVILVAGKRGCLEGNTLVFTDKGYKKIKEFDKVEDKILSFNKDKREFEWENAELLKYSMDDEELFKIVLEDRRELILTSEHPLLVSYGNRLLSLLWVNANNLRIGDKLLSFDNFNNDYAEIPIKNISKVNGINDVYDLSVPKNHSFIANGIISHNSGKSYTLGTIAEELSQLPIEARKNIAPIIFDTMGIFWTMKYENEKEKNLLSEWDLKPKKLPVKVFVPHGYFNEFVDKGIPVDEPFALKISELSAEDWVLIFGLNIIEPAAVLIERVIYDLKNKGDFDISDIISRIRGDVNSMPNEKNAALGLFEAATTWGVFSKKGEKETSIKDLITPGTTTVLDLSVYNSVGAFNVRALVIGLVSRKLFNERMFSRKKEEVESVRHGSDYLSYAQEREVPLVWVFIDEAHEFLPREGKTSATDALIQILREGRQPGLSLVLATQQPGQIHKDVMTQSDIVISHRLTAQPDIAALNEVMQTYLTENIRKYIDELPHLKGSAIILDDNSERIYPMRVRPRFTWHGGEAPSAVKIEKRF